MTSLGRPILRFLAILTLPVLLATSSSAYYYYVHYSGRSGPYSQIPEKFDLTALTNNTVPFFISDQAPAAMVPGDSYPALVSEIRAAADVWNQVSTSTLKLGYGGLFTVGTQQNAPAINIQFSDDIPPGVLALSGPQVRGAVTQGPNGSFVPIVQSQMLLKNDLSGNSGQNIPPLPSYSELFFTTLVHEFGHTFGLQHTLTSSVMSTSWTSAATRAAPLAPDDIAAISLLYPTQTYAATVGSISGRVTLSDGTGVGMASVVAISTSNAPLSALTNPDGTFEIDGLPPQQYYLYVHPLPPPVYGETTPANIRLPVDPAGKSIAAGPNFTTQFYPGTGDFNQARWVFVYPGNVTGNVNFAVHQVSAPAVSSVQIYGYSSTGVASTSPQVFVGLPTAIVAAAATGLLQNGQLTPGLNVQMFGTSATLYNVAPYYQQFLSLDVVVGSVTGPGPKHVIFATPNDIYVRPCTFTVVQNSPPLVTSLTPGADASGNRVLTVNGSNLQPDTRIFFDGIAAQITTVTADGKFIVTPPPAPGGYTAAVVALNSSDDQSSLFLQSTPIAYTYDSAPVPVITASPQFLPPGLQTSVDVVTQNTNFVDGQVSVGFGSSDIAVNKVTVLSPTHLAVLVTTPGGTFLPVSSMNITNGLRVMSQNLGFPILPEPQQ